jgi:hypothetical protein
MQVVILWFILTISTLYSVKEYDLPIVNSEILQLAAKSTNILENGKFIPNKVWIAVRNISDPLANHMNGPNGFIARNSDWEVNFCDNEAKDLFMKNYFKNTSILWAYEILNPLIGTSKAEIWRLCILYVFGGTVKYNAHYKLH